MRVRIFAALLASAACLVAQQRFVGMPGTTLQITDPTTGIPVSVRLSAFEVSSHEVTQQEYERVAGVNPSLHKGANLPVQNVTWWDAIRYCNRRSLAEGLQPCYNLTTGACDRTRNGYRLLTDAEWQYAAGDLTVAGRQPEYAHLGPSGTKDTAPLIQYARSAAPKPAGSLQPNRNGLHDMTGNVWEWVQDFQDPAGAVSFTSNPAGPQSGKARVLRGGSYMTTTSQWSRNLRTSLEPDRRSPYTGFRVCRSAAAAPPPSYDASWFAPYQQAPAEFATAVGNLGSPSAGATTAAEWSRRRPELHAKWSAILGAMNCAKPAPVARLIETHDEASYRGELLYLQVEPDYWEKIYVMIPAGANPSRPLPVVLVPFYDVDTPAGKNMGGRQTTPLGTRSYGHLAVQNGFAAVAVRWFGESYGEGMAEAVANLKHRHPKVTGLGKWVWDAQRLLDYIETRPEFDAARIGMMGHSLGGKMTLYASAMDQRIKAAVSSEPGIGLSFSNYEDFWYLGEKIGALTGGTDHHELLALIAPRPFLLIGGDSADNDKSWHYINSARQVYKLFDAPRQIGYVNHRKGHSPTPESIQLAMEWLARFL